MICKDYLQEFRERNRQQKCPDNFPAGWVNEKIHHPAAKQKRNFPALKLLICPHKISQNPQITKSKLTPTRTKPNKLFQ